MENNPPKKWVRPAALCIPDGARRVLQDGTPVGTPTYRDTPIPTQKFETVEDKLIDEVSNWRRRHGR